MGEVGTSSRLLLVEDESHLASALKLNFELEGLAVDVAQSVRAAGELLLKSQYDVIVLDVMLPDGNGFTLCKKLRDSGNFTPVLMLTARGSAKDRVCGIDSGADDYVPKPFDLAELLARVRALLRRRDWEKGQQGGGKNVLTFGDAYIDFDTHDVRAFGRPVKLTQLELDLVRYFAANPGRVLSREELLEQVWKLRNYPNTRSVDNFIVRLRKHFEPSPNKPKYFVSHRGAGYKFVPAPPKRSP